ncbi:MAG: mannitol dehydrogenase family protein [Burkholderiaceae bacterium]|nr:mannitol dehydrogenase family protein [Burkholderiaceae bacterium]
MASLAGLARPDVQLPAYPREGLACGVVHLGLGAFHRAHQAMYFDSLLAAGDTRWGVCGVATRSAALADTLAAQDSLYAVKTAGTGGESWRVVGAILGTCAARREPARVQARIAAESTRWITLTVTEKGYDADLAQLLLEGLRQRRAAGRGGLTIASCDNLSRNGELLKALLLSHCAAPASAGGDDAALAQWISRHCRFPNSMVDRIVPAATAQCADEAAQVLGLADRAALFTEQFCEWVLQDDLADPSDAAALAGCGVAVVPDVAPYEEAKLRMLNGSHSAMACIGALMDLATVFDAMAQPDLAAFLQGLMTREVMPHLARPGLPAYRDALLGRFANPAIRHALHQIATDSSRKIPLRWVPSVLAQLRAGAPVDHLAFAAAAWVRYCAGLSDAGAAFTVNDPQAALLVSLAREHAGDAPRAVAALLGLQAIWGAELAAHAGWQACVTHHAQEMAAHGTAAALRRFIALRSGAPHALDEDLQP